MRYTPSMAVKAGSLLSVLIKELTERGYTVAEPATATSGGVWTHPDWDGASDKLLPTIEDCLDRESQ